MVFVKYGGMEIQLDYSQDFRIPQKSKGTQVSAEVEKNMGNFDEEYEQAYKTAEEEVILYLIKDAIKKTRERTLIGIAKIMQYVGCDSIKKQINLTLTGIALYE